jgi:hypothetical protein
MADMLASMDDHRIHAPPAVSETLPSGLNLGGDDDDDSEGDCYDGEGDDYDSEDSIYDFSEEDDDITTVSRLKNTQTARQA